MLAPAPRILGQFWIAPGTRCCTAPSSSVHRPRPGLHLGPGGAAARHTGSVLIAGKSVEKFAEDEEVPVAKGHVRGAVLTSEAVSSFFQQPGGVGGWGS